MTGGVNVHPLFILSTTLCDCCTLALDCCLCTHVRWTLILAPYLVVCSPCVAVWMHVHAENIILVHTLFNHCMPAVDCCLCTCMLWTLYKSSQLITKTPALDMHVLLSSPRFYLSTARRFVCCRLATNVFWTLMNVFWTVCQQPYCLTAFPAIGPFEWASFLFYVG